jgi:hypothetical protein
LLVLLLLLPAVLQMPERMPHPNGVLDQRLVSSCRGKGSSSGSLQESSHTASLAAASQHGRSMAAQAWRQHGMAVQLHRGQQQRLLAGQQPQSSSSCCSCSAWQQHGMTVQLGCTPLQLRQHQQANVQWYVGLQAYQQQGTASQQWSGCSAVVCMPAAANLYY